MISKEPFVLDLPTIKTVVNELQRRIKEEEDPEELTEYRKLFQKLIPFFMRSSFAGYLLHQAVTKGNIRRKMNMKTLFFSIGRNRQVFPRDLIQLLYSAGSVSKVDIGEIKILENYCFVDVEESKAPLVIEKLNSISYRGRHLTVNFAKKRTMNDLSTSELPMNSTDL